jgi:hypothetical protein
VPFSYTSRNVPNTTVLLCVRKVLSSNSEERIWKFCFINMSKQNMKSVSLKSYEYRRFFPWRGSINKAITDMLSTFWRLLVSWPTVRWLAVTNSWVWCVPYTTGVNTLQPFPAPNECIMGWNVCPSVLMFQHRNWQQIIILRGLMLTIYTRSFHALLISAFDVREWQASRFRLFNPRRGVAVRSL